MARPHSSTTGFSPHRSWQPLPFIHSGFIIFPFHPETSPPPTPTTIDQTSPRLPPLPPHRDLDIIPWAGGRPDVGDGKRNPYEIPLDVGDEFYAFEEYRCSLEEDGRGDLWYRGFVVQAVSITSLAPAPSSTTSTLQPATFPRPEPSVLTGIFPAAVCHLRPGEANDNARLSEAYQRAVQAAEEMYRKAQDNPNGLGRAWAGEMDTVTEEDEEQEDMTSQQTHQTTPSRGVVEVGLSERRSSETLLRRPSLKGTISKPGRPKSLILESQEQEYIVEKEEPPLPKLTAGDSTLAGQQWPLVDEIACAIREWYGRLPTYLANREYRLFSTVVQHIDALFLGRRQLLSQMLSGDELVRVRRECVSRLVKGNVAQGLDVIVRSLEDGSVVVVDRERAYNGTRWVGGISCYVYQVRLAYIDLIPLDKVFGKVFPYPDARHPAPSQPFSLAAAKSLAKDEQSCGSYYHLLLDVHAFIANFCAAGETAELYFSLYSKSENNFLSEEFCLILNQHGSPARDSEQRLGRLRTLFTDLKAEDLAPDTYLVCKIIRNGAMKMRLDSGIQSPIPTLASRRTSLYGISENGNHTTRTHLRAPSSTLNLTDDSFSITSGFGPEPHRAPTVDTTNESAAHPSLAAGRPKSKRPLGVAVMLLPGISKLMGEGLDNAAGQVDQSMPIYVPRDEAGFVTLHEDVINNRVKQYGRSSMVETVALSLKAFQGSAPQLIRKHPSLLGDIPITSRLSFPDAVYPDQTRDDLYINLISATFTPAAPNTGSIRMKRNAMPSHHGDVQISMEVRKMDGTVLNGGIVGGGSGEPAVDRWNSLVFHRNDKPTFGELVKVSLPNHSVGYHLYLTFRSKLKDKHAEDQEQETPFAFAYLPLISIAGQTPVVKDGDYELVLYRMEKSLQPSPNTYFDAPFAAKELESASPATVSRNMTPLKDRVLIRTRLCSSVQTQDDTLRDLFAWQKAASAGDITGLCETLQLFGFVPEEELAHFVPKVLDSLFGILVSNLGEKQDQVDDLVFKSLVKVLAMTTDRRFPNFKNVLDIYIETIYSFPASSFHLLRSMKSVMSTPNNKDYRSFLKVWHLFFRFIIRSRELDRTKGMGLDATSAHIEADFQKQTQHILGEINNLMESPDKSLIGTQTLAVQHYSDILPDLVQVFKPLQIAELVIAFADTLSYAKGSIAIYKLLLLLQVVRHAFDTSQSRSLLVPAIVRWVQPHLGRYNEWNGGMNEDQGVKDGKRLKWLECNRLAVTVLAWVINKLQEWHVSPLVQEDEDVKRQEEENIEYCLSVLPALYASYTELSSPETLEFLARQRSSATSTVWKATSDIFPISHPFPLISQLPPPSLLERHQHADDDGLPRTEIFNCGLAECATVIVTLVIATPKENIVRWLNETLDIEGAESCSELFTGTFGFARSIITFQAFPRQWLTLRCMCFSGIIKLLECIGSVMERAEFVPPPPTASSENHSQNGDRSFNFDVNLWQNFLELLCDFCASEELCLEDQTQQRRRAEWIVAGDLRDASASLLTKLWNALGWPLDIPGGEALRLGGYQTRFTSLAGRIIELCISSHDGLCETAVDILFAMIYAEFLLDRKQATIETDIFVILDKLFTSKATSSASDPAMRAYFVAQLREVFETTPEIDPRFTSQTSNFLSQVELFIDLLLALRDIPNEPLWKDERSAAIYCLMAFVNRIGRNDLYVRYVHELVKINRQVKDWLGAALALKLHADVYGWLLGGEHWVEAAKWGEIDLPAQSQFARKQMIYYHVLELLAQAEAYEFSIDLCQELTTQHQKLTYDVAVLSDLLVHQAKMWEQIARVWRPKPEYFRVVYFGDIVSLDKGKDYIVRALAGMKYGDFCDSFQTKYPQATIHRSKIPPPESIKTGTDSVIWIMPVSPDPDLSKAAFGENVSDNVQSYWKWNGIKMFNSLRPYLKDPGEREAALTWTEKTILTTKEELPGVLSRSEVISVKYEQIAPMVMATVEVDKSTKYLQKACLGKKGQPPESKLLGTAINNAVDSPVSDSVRNYRQLFVAGNYADNHPQERGLVEHLEKAIFNYVQAIRESLDVHKRVCKDIAFHEALKTNFYKAFPEETSQLPRLSASVEDLIPKFSVNGTRLDKDYQSPSISQPSISISLHRSSGSTFYPADRRLSAISARSTTGSGYYSPPLRIGLAGEASDDQSSNGDVYTPRGSIATTRQSPSGPNTASVSSPNSSVRRAQSKRGSMRKKENRSSLTAPLENGFGYANASVASLSAKARSMMSFGGQSSVSIVEENDGQGVEKTTLPPLPPKERGLRRFGSLIRGK